MSTMKQAVIYCRVGNPNQIDVEEQGAALVHYAYKHGYIANIVYLDKGTRLSFDKMMEFLSSNSELAIVTSSRNRLTHDESLLRVLELQHEILTLEDN